MQKWPADRVERRSVGSLIPQARNARTHTDAQIAQIAASMKEWGWTNPILIDEDGSILAGHGRVLAARLLGITEVPAMIAEGWSDAQKHAYVIADNQLALNAGWDMGVLANEVKGLEEWGFDLSLLGFDNLDQLLNEQSGELGSGAGAGSLAAKFGVPPFSVLNAREGWWQDRKAAWIALGIKSELGRGSNELGLSDQAEEYRQSTDAYSKRPDAIPGGAGKNAAWRRGGANATPGGSLMPAADYSRSKSRGDGKGRPLEKS